LQKQLDHLDEAKKERECYKLHAIKQRKTQFQISIPFKRLVHLKALHIIVRTTRNNTTQPIHNNLGQYILISRVVYSRPENKLLNI